MRIVIAAVGRLKSGPERDLYERYAGLLRWPLTLREIEEKRRLPADKRKEREGERILAAFPEGGVVVALDAGGKPLSSEAFARKIGDWRDAGIADVAFAIGGAEGLHEAVKCRADLVWSLGAVTWPHMLVRGLLAEQLYRAQQILAGHPYHRGGNG